MSEKTPKLAAIRPKSDLKQAKAALEEVAESLPPDTDAVIVIVSTKSGGCFPIFHGMNTHLLWMLETSKFELLLGGDEE